MYNPLTNLEQTRSRASNTRERLCNSGARCSGLACLHSRAGQVMHWPQNSFSAQQSIIHSHLTHLGQQYS